MTVGSVSLGVAEPYLIQQDWQAYTPEQHATWTELVGRRMAQIEAHACQEYVEGFQQIGLRANQIPHLGEVNQRLTPLTGWRATPVSGSCHRVRFRHAGSSPVPYDDLAP